MQQQQHYTNTFLESRKKREEKGETEGYLMKLRKNIEKSQKTNQRIRNMQRKSQKQKRRTRSGRLKKTSTSWKLQGGDITARKRNLERKGIKRRREQEERDVMIRRINPEMIIVENKKKYI